MITILGPTASGKTELAAALAAQVSGEVISADSRQVYKGMTIGTGKDLDEYEVNGISIPYHLIDIHEAGYEYNVFEYQQDFFKTYQSILNRGNTPILCGGTGMYIDAVLKGYKLVPVPHNERLRSQLSIQSHDQLILQLQAFGSLHNTTDTSTVKRTIRAIEIATYYQAHDIQGESLPQVETKIYGIHWERDILKTRITQRLLERLDHGMVDEVSHLIELGVGIDKLKYYGLEYKFIGMYLVGEIEYDEMVEKLSIGIHQFSKKQMTWFRRMEKQGFEINWIAGELHLEEKLKIILNVTS